MNCKQGDLAIVVTAFKNKNVGKVIKCLEYKVVYGQFDAWLADDDIIYTDDCLRPIRPDEGQDETLTWKKLPEPVTA